MLVSEPLSSDHVLDRFECGEARLDGWLRASALAAQQRRTARTYVWHQGDRIVVGYFTLAPHLIERSELPRSLAHGEPTAVPAILLARLALDRRLHGRGLGAQLLRDALEVAVSATATVGGRYVVVDAIDDRAVAFYERFGFRRAPDPTARRLLRKVSDIVASLGS